jgi:hypothetical protein
VRLENLELLQENIGETFEDLVISNSFLNRSLIAQGRIAKIDKWNHIKFKDFCTAKETITRVKRQSTKWEKNFARYSSDRVR